MGSLKYAKFFMFNLFFPLNRVFQIYFKALKYALVFAEKNILENLLKILKTWYFCEFLKSKKSS